MQIRETCLFHKINGISIATEMKGLLKKKTGLKKNGPDIILIGCVRTVRSLKIRPTCS
jgi:hypothetical protein